MTKRIISELFNFMLSGIGAILIIAFLLLFQFGGKINNNFFHILICQNFLYNPIQGLAAIWFILNFIIILTKQKKSNFNDFITNYILIFSGFILEFFFIYFILNAQRRKENIISEVTFNAQRMNIPVTSNQFSNKFEYYNYNIIFLSILLLVVGFIIVKTITKTKKLNEMQP